MSLIRRSSGAVLMACLSAATLVSGANAAEVRSPYARTLTLKLDQGVEGGAFVATFGAPPQGQWFEINNVSCNFATKAEYSYFPHLAVAESTFAARPGRIKTFFQFQNTGTTQGGEGDSYRYYSFNQNTLIHSYSALDLTVAVSGSNIMASVTCTLAGFRVDPS